MTDATIRKLRGDRFLRFLVAGAINSLFRFLVYSAAILFGAVDAAGVRSGNAPG